MSQIKQTLHRQTPAERLDATLYISPFPRVARVYAYLMLSIAVRLQRDAATNGGVA